MQYTHKQLVNIARKWLTSRCAIVVTELITNGREQPDALGFRSDGLTALIECKASRTDFLADRKKFFRHDAEYGMGEQRYYLAPANLIQEDELPEGWGLLTWNGKRVKVVRESGYFDQHHARCEKQVLISAMRRLGISERNGICVRVYTINREASKRKATLGIVRDGSIVEAKTG